jgi:hypothetical protein
MMTVSGSDRRLSPAEVFVKLGITSRDQLAQVLPVRPDTTVPVAPPR